VAAGLSAYAGKTILITGANGYLGSALTAALDAADCRVVLLARRPHGTRPPEPADAARYRVIRGDVAGREIWREALPGVDYVFHLAAHEHRHGAGHEPEQDLRVNLLSTLHLFEVCRSEGLTPRIVFASSSNLVGLPAQLPVGDDAPDDPLTVYAIHKLASEYYLRHYAREYQLPGVTLRLTNVYGPSPRAGYEVNGRVVLNGIVSAALHGGCVALYRNRACIRDYVFVDDVTRAFLAAGASQIRDGRHFVIGSGEACRIADAVGTVVERIARRGWRRPEVRVDEAVAIEPVELRNFVADTSGFRAATGWTPRVMLEEGVDRTIDYFAAELAG
jgi:nucleoside-diphosphate-sugar epimerase